MNEPYNNPAETKPELKLKKQSIVRELLEFSLIVLLIIFPIRFFVIQPFIVVGQSMEPTFHTNEYLIVDEISYNFTEPKRGEVIIFKYPSVEQKTQKEVPSKYFIKRVIGLPGEKILIKNGLVTIFNTENPEGFTLSEPYIKYRDDTSTELTLKENQYYVMGDNRKESFDSRSWGPVDATSITGRALVRIFPLTKMSLYPGDETEK